MRERERQMDREVSLEKKWEINEERLERGRYMQRERGGAGGNETERNIGRKKKEKICRQTDGQQFVEERQ